LEEIIYKIKSAEIDEIIAHLEISSPFFTPPLTERINIEDYSLKIFNMAITFEAWNNKRLIGIIATYFNEDTCKGFITNVSVLIEFTNRGISSNLLKMCIEYAIKHNILEIDLEVDKDNERATNVYRKFGFIAHSIKNNTILMQLVL